MTIEAVYKSPDSISTMTTFVRGDPGRAAKPRCFKGPRTFQILYTISAGVQTRQRYQSSEMREGAFGYCNAHVVVTLAARVRHSMLVMNGTRLEELSNLPLEVSSVASM